MNFRKIFDDVPENLSVIDIDENYTMLYANKSHLSTVQLKLEEFVGKGIFDLFPDTSGSLQTIKSCLDEVKKTKKYCKPPVLRYDIPGENGNIEMKYWNLQYTPVLGDTGEVEYIIQTSFDVTNLVNLGFPF